MDRKQVVCVCSRREHTRLGSFLPSGTQIFLLATLTASAGSGRRFTIEGRRHFPQLRSREAKRSPFSLPPLFHPHHSMDPEDCLTQSRPTGHERCREPHRLFKLAILPLRFSLPGVLTSLVHLTSSEETKHARENLPSRSTP